MGYVSSWICYELSTQLDIHVHSTCEFQTYVRCGQMVIDQSCASSRGNFCFRILVLSLE